MTIVAGIEAMNVFGGQQLHPGRAPQTGNRPVRKSVNARKSRGIAV